MDGGHKRKVAPIKMCLKNEKRYITHAVFRVGYAPEYLYPEFELFRLREIDIPRLSTLQKPFHF